MTWLEVNAVLEASPEERQKMESFGNYRLVKQKQKEEPKRARFTNESEKRQVLEAIEAKYMEGMQNRPAVQQMDVEEQKFVTPSKSDGARSSDGQGGTGGNNKKGERIMIGEGDMEA